MIGTLPPSYGFSDFNIDAVGDWDCNSNTQDTANNIKAKNPELVLGLGDYSYKDTATCWLSIIRPFDSITKINIGNHDDSPSSLLSTYKSHFGLSNQYYSFNYQNVHVLIMATELSTSSSSSQYSFIKNDLLQASQNPNIRWIIVSMHDPVYSSPNKCSIDSCQGSTSLQKTYHSIFDLYHVDIVLQGHTHSYQRTYPIKFNPNDSSKPVVTNTNKNSYTNPEGAIFAIVGIGGTSLHTLSGQAPFVASQHGIPFGILDLKVTNGGNTLEGKNYGDDGSTKDSFTITKTAINVPPVANSQTVSLTKNTPKPITLTANDQNGDPLVYSVVKQPLHGTLTGNAPSLTYNPNIDYLGTDSFTFKTNDGKVDSNIASVNITVTAPSDTTPPTVTSTDPTNGATGIAVSKVITAAFSEPVQSASASTSTFILKAGTASIAGSVGLNVNTNTASFTPSSPLSASTLYTATIKGGTAGVKDTAGNTMTSDYSWSFTTAVGSTPTCGNNMAQSNPTSSGNQNSFPPSNAIDNNFNTKWYSTFIEKPWIRVELGALKSICGVDIAWADGNSRQYSFIISVSTDGTGFTDIFTGKSKGTTTSSEKYSFSEVQARFVKITITQSHAGIASSIAQISEIDTFGKSSTTTTTTTSTVTSLPSSSNKISISSEPDTKNINTKHSDGKSGSNITTSLNNHAPVAHDDKIETEVNSPVLVPILENDKDYDGDKLKIDSVSPHSKKGGRVTINSNGTITFMPAIEFVGSDTFTYILSDEKGKEDRGKVSVLVKPLDINKLSENAKEVAPALPLLKTNPNAVYEDGSTTDRMEGKQEKNQNLTENGLDR